MQSIKKLDMMAIVQTFLILLLACSTLFSMTLEEKVGQMLMVHFQGDRINPDAKRLIDEAHVGGFIFFNWSNGALSIDQVCALTHSLQSYSPRPLLFAIDQEGGRVQRLREGFTDLPAPCKMHQAFEMGCTVGQELKSAGLHLNLAPVTEPYLKDRSHCNPTAFVDGMHQAGILACAKHYPGYGENTIDAHFGLPVTDGLQPFRICHADVVMTAHVLVPSVDPNWCATLSKRWMQKLRAEFDGVIITDSLTMGGVLKQAGSLKQAALLALQAGCDILLLGIKITDSEDEKVTCEELLAIHSYLVDAIKAGEIDEKRIDDSVQRILHLKDRVW